MSQPQNYLDCSSQPLTSIVSGVDRDVEHGENILMLGYSLVLMAPIFAPIAPPKVLLPLMALAFLISVCFARKHFLAMGHKLTSSIALLDQQHLARLQPILQIFTDYPEHSLTIGFNPLKNVMRTLKSLLGALMINPFWMPIFYMLGLQFVEDKQLCLLNKAVILVEQDILSCHKNN